MNDEIKEILIKDFNEILVPEFTTDWKEKRFYIQLLIETMPLINLLDYITDLQEENERLKKELNKHIKEGIEKDQEIERLNNIIEKTESMLKRLMEEQEYCYKKYPENWEERTGVSNTWLTSRDCYWSALNYLIKLKGNDKE